MKISSVRPFGLVFLFMTVVFLSGCSIEADNVLTDADKLKKELEEIIEKKDISKASVYLLRTKQVMQLHIFSLVFIYKDC